MKKIFDNLLYAVFGVFEPKPESEKLDIAHGGEDHMPPSETKKEAEKRQNGQGLKIMTPSQLITRLSILLAQVKAGNNSQKLKNQIRQIACLFFVQVKKPLKNNLKPFNQHYLKMETIFMNTKNSKTTESNRFRLYFTDKLDLRGNKTIALAT